MKVMVRGEIGAILLTDEEVRSLREQASRTFRTGPAGTVIVVTQHALLDSTFAKRTTLRHDVAVQTKIGTLIVRQSAHLVLADSEGGRRILVYRNEVAYDIHPELPRYELIELSEEEWLIYDHELLQPSNEVSPHQQLEGKFLGRENW